MSGDNQVIDEQGKVSVLSAVAIPSGTTYVLNTNSKKIHLTTCRSINDISEKNISYSTESIEQLISRGFTPCKRCNPYLGNVGANTVNNDAQQEVNTQNATGGAYVLNTNTKKFHKPTCSSVGDMSPKNRQDVNLTRDEIIAQGYSPCKRCNP